MALDSLLGKKYKLATSEKFDEYMKALGKYGFSSLLPVYFSF